MTVEKVAVCQIAYNGGRERKVRASILSEISLSQEGILTPCLVRYASRSVISLIFAGGLRLRESLLLMISLGSAHMGKWSIVVGVEVQA